MIAAFRSLLALGLAAASAFAQPAVDLPRLSPPASVSQSIGYTNVTISYSRPAVRGRKIWKDLVPYGKVWRAGANEATVIEFSTDVKVNGRSLPKGRYGLFIIPDEKEWTFAFSKAYKAWGAFTYDEKEDALRVKVPTRSAEFRERLEYGFEDLTDSSATLFMSWEKKKLPIGIVVEFLETAKANIRKSLPKAKAGDPFPWLSAARFYWTYDIDRKQAMQWVDKSIAVKPIYGNLWTKAEWLADGKDYAEAAKYARRAREAAERDPNPKPLLEAIDKATSSWPAASTQPAAPVAPSSTPAPASK
jgi:hypothetical protein